MLPLETNSSLNKCACTTHNKWGSWERPAWLNSKCCPNSNSPLCHCHSSLVLCSNTWTTSQPHCSHIQPQRCSSGPQEPIEKGLLAAFPKRPLQAAVSCFFSFPRQILAHFGTKPTVLHQSHRSPGKPHYLLHMHGSLRGGSFLSRFPFKIIAFGKLWQQCVFPTSA